MSELNEKYALLQKKFEGDDFSSFSQEEIEVLIEELFCCNELIRAEALFSPNEELDDIATSSIKFLSIDYYIGKCKCNLHDRATRKEKLLQSKLYFHRFLKVGQQYQILDKSELKKFDSEKGKLMTGDEKRTFKIEKYKREKVAKQRIQEIKRLLRLRIQDQSSSSAAIDYEEEEREMFILLLQGQLRDTLDELDLLEEELQMIQYRDDHATAPSSSSSSNNSSQQQAAAAGSSSGGGGGITMMKTYKVGDQLMMTRATEKGHVFGDGISYNGMAGPSMTLAEFGDRERLAAEARSAASAATASSSSSGAANNGEATGQTTKKYRDLLAAGEEDDDDLMDQATMADRAWDSWKEQNPKGMGNKMNKRF